METQRARTKASVDILCLEILDRYLNDNARYLNVSEIEAVNAGKFEKSEQITIAKHTIT